MLTIFKKISVLLLTIPLITISCFFNVQAQSISSVSDSLQQYQRKHLQEKLFVHTDKDYYISGEIIWFKIYCVDASFHRPLDASKVSYVELLDSANHAVLQAKISMNHATGQGSLPLPAAIYSGNYTLRAYTRWMTNNDADWFYHKTITVTNPNKLPPIALSNKQTLVDIQFFPEGGQLVNGIESRVAFKAEFTRDQQTEFTGYLMDNNDTLLQFIPSHNNMGYFKLTPKDGHHYTADILTTGKNESVKKLLPSALEKGAIIHVKERNGTYYITIKTTNNNPEFQVLVHSRGIVKRAENISVKNGEAIYLLPVSALADGISAVTVFDHASRPLAERLIFKQPQRLLTINSQTNDTLFSKRQQVTVIFKADSTSIKSDSANISLAVFRIDSLQHESPDDITAYLLLSSDIKGYINQPSQYLQQDSISREALDILLMTQGWRRFNWQQVQTHHSSANIIAPELQGHIITGKLSAKQPGLSVRNQIVYLSAISGNTIFKAAVSNQDGDIKADIDNFYSNGPLLVQPKDSGYTVTINSPFSTLFQHRPISPLHRPLQNPQTLLEQYISMQVQNIYSGSHMNRFAYPSSMDTSPFYHQPDYHYKLEDYTRFTTIEEILREYVTLVDVKKRNQSVDLSVIDPVRKKYLSGRPLNLLDGVPLQNFSKLMETAPHKLQSLELLAKEYISGNTSFSGILNWKSYEPSNSSLSSPFIVVNNEYKGLQTEREFYQPQYTTPALKASPVPDFRNVLHWQPEIILQPNLPVSIHFFTSDLAGKYVLAWQGIADNGMMGSGSVYFTVK